MKKLITTLLCGTLIALSLVGCSKDSKEKTDVSEIASETDASEIETSEENNVVDFTNATYENSSWVSRIDWSNLEDLNELVVYEESGISFPMGEDDTTKLYNMTSEMTYGYPVVYNYGNEPSETTIGTYCAELENVSTLNSFDCIINEDVEKVEYNEDGTVNSEYLHNMTPTIWVHSDTQTLYILDFFNGIYKPLDKDNVEINTRNVMVLNDLIKNNLGKPDYVYCSTDKLDEVDKYISFEGDTVVRTCVIWSYEDGSTVVVNGTELAYDDGIHLSIQNITYSKDTYYLDSILTEMMNNNLIDVKPLLMN